MGHYFYIVKDNTTGLYKMGATSQDNIKSRLWSLRSQYPEKDLEVIMTVEKSSRKEAFALEKTLLQQYHVYRTGGEWVKLPDDAKINCDIIEQFPYCRPYKVVIHFNAKYSLQGGVCKFVSMTKERKHGSLTLAAKHFGFSRERARQIWKALEQGGYMLD